jgi:hypothetical protein
MTQEKKQLNIYMTNDSDKMDFQKFLDQKMKEIKDGKIENIIRRRKEREREVENETMPLKLEGDPIEYNMRNPEDAEIVKSYFNKEVEKIKSKLNTPPTLKQLRTQYPNG